MVNRDTPIRDLSKRDSKKRTVTKKTILKGQPAGQISDNSLNKWTVSSNWRATELALERLEIRD